MASWLTSSFVFSLSLSTALQGTGLTHSTTTHPSSLLSFATLAYGGSGQKQSVFILIVALYIIFTGSGSSLSLSHWLPSLANSYSALTGTQFNPGAFLEDTSPYAWALTGVALNIGLSVIGAGWCVSLLSLSSPLPRCLPLSSFFTILTPLSGMIRREMEERREQLVRLADDHARSQGHLDHRRLHPRCRSARAQDHR